MGNYTVITFWDLFLKSNSAKFSIITYAFCKSTGHVLTNDNIASVKNCTSQNMFGLMLEEVNNILFVPNTYITYTYHKYIIKVY